MSSVIIPSNGYYQLSGQQSDLLSSGGSSNASSPTQSLIDALDSASSGGYQSSSSSSYTLDLSPTAQQLLSGGSASSYSSTTGNSSTFTLTTAQKNTINSILEKYKNAPYDQATFDQIQNDLATAGLSPDQLAAQDQVNSFNPTALLVNALSGNYTDPGSQNITQSTTEQSKISQYMQNILSLWQNDSSSTSTTGQTSSQASS